MSTGSSRQNAFANDHQAPFTRYSLFYDTGCITNSAVRSTRLSNRFDRRLYRVNGGISVQSIADGVSRQLTRGRTDHYSNIFHPGIINFDRLC